MATAKRRRRKNGKWSGKNVYYLYRICICNCYVNPDY